MAPNASPSRARSLRGDDAPAQRSPLFCAGATDAAKKVDRVLRCNVTRIPGLQLSTTSLAPEEFRSAVSAYQLATPACPAALQSVAPSSASSRAEQNAFRAVSTVSAPAHLTRARCATLQSARPAESSSRVWRNEVRLRFSSCAHPHATTECSAASTSAAISSPSLCVQGDEPRARSARSAQSRATTKCLMAPTLLVQFSSSFRAQGDETGTQSALRGHAHTTTESSAILDGFGSAAPSSLVRCNRTRPRSASRRAPLHQTPAHHRIARLPLFLRRPFVLPAHRPDSNTLPYSFARAWVGAGAGATVTRELAEG